jgi:hemolysin activation/secretion protein
MMLCGAVHAQTQAPENKISKAETEAGVASAEEQSPTFDIWEYQVDGNHLLGKKEIERVVYPFLGPKRSYEDVESARVALQDAYRRQGYVQVAVTIPIQEVSQGVVSIKVVEPKVENLWVSGGRYFSPRKLRKQLTAIEKGAVIKEDRVNQQLSKVNKRNSDLKVVPVLRPGQAPGTVEVEVKVKDELPLHAEVEINNEHTADTSDLRLKATASYGNLWQADHKLSLLGLISPQETDEVKVFAANYMMPVGEGDNKLLLSVMRTDSSVETIGGITVVGTGNIFSANLIKPLKPKGSLFSTLMFGMEYRDLDNRDPTGGTEIDYLGFSTDWLGNKLYESGGRTEFDFGIRFGFNGLVNEQDEFTSSRIGSKAGYLVADASIEHHWKFANDSLLSMGLMGQTAAFPLISNLQISAGGVGSVRGYYESQVLADTGVLASLEWTSPNLGNWISSEGGEKRELYFSVFTEGAWLWDREPFASGTKEFYLSSIGVGSQLNAFDGFFAKFYLAWPLNSVGEVSEGDAMGHFGLGYKF